MNLSELLAKGREQDPHAGPAALADWLLAQAVSSHGVGVLYPAVLAWVEQAERARVRLLEEEAFSPEQQEPGDGEQGGPAGSRHPSTERPPRTEPYVNPAQAAMQKLLAESCYVRGQGLVPWGEMTAEYHQLRVAYLEEKIANYVRGNRATIRRHQAAARLLEESGLRDLDAYLSRYGGLPDDLVT